MNRKKEQQQLVVYNFNKFKSIVVIFGKQHHQSNSLNVHLTKGPFVWDKVVLVYYLVVH